MASFRKVEAWALIVGLACAPGSPGPVARADDSGGGRSVAIAGQVVRPGGDAVAGAEVFVATGVDADPTSPTRRERTDAAGRFRLDWRGPTTGSGIATLWAYHPDLGLVRLAVAADRPASAPPVRLTLAALPAGAAATVRVIGPRGEAAAGVRVRPRLWYGGGLPADSAHQGEVPPELAGRLEALTDAEGRATFPALPALQLAGVAVEVPGSAGAQLGEWDQGWDARVRGVRLREVGAVVGKVRGDDDRPRAGWSVEVRTRVEGRVAGVAAATTDRDGRFALEGIAAGPLEVHAEPPAGDDEVAARATYRAMLIPGRTAGVEIHARRGVRVGGRVIDRESGAPIAGARVVLAGPDAPDRRVATGPDGRFEAVLRVAPDRVRVEAAPEPYLVPLPRAGDPGRLGGSVPPPDGPILALDRGLMIGGSIGRPPGGAADGEIGTLEVRARWDERAAQGRSQASRSSRVGVAADGTFAIGPVPPGVAVTLGAGFGVEGPPGPEVHAAAAPGGGPIRLTAPDRAAGATLVGRVVGPGGVPLAGVLVQFRASPANRPAADRADHRVTTDGLDAVVTDPDGRFRRPVRLGPRVDPGWRWSAAVAGEGDSSPMAVGAEGPAGEVDFPTIALTGGDEEEPLIGRVEGSDGRAVAGASVRDLAGHQTATDAEGRFRIPRPGRDAGAPPLLVVEHADYRCSGVVVRGEAGPDDRPLVLTLVRLDEPAPGRHARPAPGPSEGAFEAEIGRILARRDPVATASLVEHLAEARPERAANLLRAGTIPDPRVADGLRALVARHLAAAGDPEAAGPVLEAIEAPEARARARLAVVAAATHLPSDRRAPLVERVERDARSIDDLRARVGTLGEVAGAWLDLGQPDRARAVLGEAEAGAESLPRATAGVAAWSGLVPVLARLDPSRARDRLDALPDPRLADRGRLAAARALGRAEPAEAARFFREVRDRRLAGGAIAEVAHRIALRDPRLARSLVDSLHDRYPVEAAHALGMLAHALPPANRAEAVALLRLAFDRLAASAQAGRVALGPGRPAEPSHAASALLAVVEAVDPGLVPEFAWRAVALHDARPGCGPDGPGRRCSVAVLAALLHRYDPALALGLFDPARIDPAALPAADLEILLVVTARLAPHLAGRWVDATTHLAGRDRHLARLVAVLAPPRSVPPGLDARHLLHLWAPGPGPARP